MSGGGLAFGIYDALDALPRDSLANIEVTCDRDGGPRAEDVVVALNAGANGTSVANRRMRHLGGSGDHLSYALYSDNARTRIWGDSPGIDTFSQQATVSNKSSTTITFTIFGRIAPHQDVSLGSYSDSVRMTVMP